MNALRVLYPEIEPYRTGRLKVSPLHEIYFEECGSPGGKRSSSCMADRVAASRPSFAAFTIPDPIASFCSISAAAESRRLSGIARQHTWDLVADMERLRELLGIKRWQVLGGSWGSTLALAYAEMHPQRVSELILRSVFLLRQSELRWFYQEGASWIFPDAWEAYAAPIPEMEQHDMIAAYQSGLPAAMKQRLRSVRAPECLGKHLPITAAQRGPRRTIGR